MLSDPASGLISACSITVPAGIRDYFRMDGLFGISDVDPRWQEYEIPEDAFCEALTARVMQAFARVLGLSANVAGSYAYSPAQLRDPAFTREHGITASVTDDVLFNTDRALADSLIRSKAGDPAYLYLPYAQSSPDPRCYRGDLGNDPFEEYATAIGRYGYIAANAPRWYETTVPHNTTFRTVLAEQVLRHHCTEHKKLARLVGGLYVQDMSTGSKYVAVSRDEQKRALSMAIDGLDKLDYLDSARELLAFSGAYNGFATLMRVNALTQNAMLGRLKWSAVSTKLGLSEYPIGEMLSDVTDVITSNLRKGSVPEGDDFLVEIWMARGLMRSLPVYEQNNKEYNHKAIQLQAPVPVSENFYGPVLENACITEIDRLEDILKKSLRAAQGEYDKNRIRYLLSQLEGMKGTKTP